jgi:hypothetical protein
VIDTCAWPKRWVTTFGEIPDAIIHVAAERLRPCTPMFGKPSDSACARNHLLTFCGQIGSPVGQVNKRRAEARYAIRGFADADAKLAGIGCDNIVDALDAALPHVRDDLVGRLRTAITTTQQLVDRTTTGTKGQP